MPCSIKLGKRTRAGRFHFSARNGDPARGIGHPPAGDGHERIFVSRHPSCRQQLTAGVEGDKVSPLYRIWRFFSFRPVPQALKC